MNKSILNSVIKHIKLISRFYIINKLLLIVKPYQVCIQILVSINVRPFNPHLTVSNNAEAPAGSIPGFCPHICWHGHRRWGKCCVSEVGW